MDVAISREGTIWRFKPLNQKADEWFADNVESEDWQWLGSWLCADRRCGVALREALIDAGLEVTE